jgi:signal peptidase
VHVLRRLSVVALLLVALSTVGTLAFLWSEGYRGFAVRTGSMMPTHMPGDLVITKPPTTFEVGDVITYKSAGEDGLTTHRVVGVGPELQTKGDANETPDVGAVDPDDVVGRVVGAVPKGGYAVVFFQQPAGIASTMTLVIALLCLYRLCFPSSETQGTGDAPATEDRRRQRYTPQHAADRYAPRHAQPQ